MRENDGRQVDHKTLETLRLRAVAQVEGGGHPEDVAAALGLHRSTVFAWVAKYREGGEGALKAKPVPGRPAKLTGPKLRRLCTLVVGSDPRQMRFESALWTREMVRQLIRREFGVAVSVVTVGRLLHRLGLPPQQRSLPCSVDTYPGTAAAAQREGAIVYFADEAGAHVDCHTGTTWAPAGHGPGADGTGQHAVNIVSAVTAKGALRFAFYEGAVTAATFTDFCQRLLHDAGGPVHLIVDGQPAHRVTAAREFAASGGSHMKFFFLPR